VQYDAKYLIMKFLCRVHSRPTLDPISVPCSQQADISSNFCTVFTAGRHWIQFLYRVHSRPTLDPISVPCSQQADTGSNPQVINLIPTHKSVHNLKTDFLRYIFTSSYPTLGLPTYLYLSGYICCGFHFVYISHDPRACYVLCLSDSPLL
jgi:hypothetical protein